MARDKARAVSSRFPDAIVVGADTIVVCENQILEKPADANDARRMLAMLSSRTHTVVTAFALARGGKILESSPVESQVTFRKLTDAEIAAYIATDEPFDKAGAYGIQGVGGGFISHVEGSRDNVMGLPTERVVAALARIRREGCLAKMSIDHATQRATDDRASTDRRGCLQGGSRRFVDSARAREQDAVERGDSRRI